MTQEAAIVGQTLSLKNSFDKMVKEIFTANHKDEIGLCKSTMTQSCYPPPEQKYDVFKIHSQLLGMQTCTYLIGSACCTSLW